jgi:hypothetical protein
MLGIERTKTFIKDIKKAKFSEFLEILSKYTKAAWNILAALSCLCNFPIIVSIFIPRFR